MSRKDFAMLYVGLDSVSVVVVMVFMLLMQNFVAQEVEEVEKKLVEVQDFTVRITNMPSLKPFLQYNTVELKAALWTYLK